MWVGSSTKAQPNTEAKVSFMLPFILRFSGRERERPWTTCKKKKKKNQRLSSEPWTGLGFLSCVRYLLPFWSRANNLIPLAMSMTPGIRALLIFWDCCEIVYVKSIFHQRRALQKHAIPPRAEASSLLLGTGQSVVQQRALSSGPQGRQH